MRNIFFAVMTLTFFAKCAIPCPPDKKEGTLNFSADTRSFLPEKQKVNEMTFENTDGRQLVFVNNNPDWNKRAKIGVEILCERGDFLDKTVQSAYYDVESVHLFYVNGTSTEQHYNINIDLVFEHIGNGTKADTAFFETVTVWGQRLLNPIATGGSMLSMNTRGNDSRIPAFHKTNQSHFVADTIIANRRIQNAFVALDTVDKFKVFYTKQNGVEAFTTPIEAWIRKF